MVRYSYTLRYVTKDGTIKQCTQTKVYERKLKLSDEMVELIKEIYDKTKVYAATQRELRARGHNISLHRLKKVIKNA